MPRSVAADQHGHGRLTEVVLIDGRVSARHRVREGRGRWPRPPRPGAGLDPRRRQLPEPAGIGHDHEIPLLAVRRRRRTPSGFEDPVEVRRRDRPVVVGAHVATGANGVPSLHGRDATTSVWPIPCSSHGGDNCGAHRRAGDGRWRRKWWRRSSISRAFGGRTPRVAPAARGLLIDVRRLGMRCRNTTSTDGDHGCCDGRESQG